MRSIVCAAAVPDAEAWSGKITLTARLTASHRRPRPLTVERGWAPIPHRLPVRAAEVRSPAPFRRRRPEVLVLRAPA